MTFFGKFAHSKQATCKGEFIFKYPIFLPFHTIHQGKWEGDGKSVHRHFSNQWNKWTEKGEFSSDDHSIYSCGQESLRRNGAAIIVNKSLKCSTWMQSPKWQSDLCSFPRQTIQHHVTQAYALTSNVEEANVEWFYEDIQNHLELSHRKYILFIIGDWNAEVGSQEIPGVTGKVCLGVQNEAGQRITEFCQENALVVANILFQKHKRWLYTWTSPDGQCQNQIDYILYSQRWRSSIESARATLRADCGSDHEILIAKST